MNSSAQRSARAALDAARPAVARLDATRGSEDLAADLIEVWSAAEAALRSLVGTTVLSGQPLIREARQRQALNFDQANSLAEFQAVHDRLQSTSYRPTEADVNSARNAFLKLDAALMGDTGIEPPRAAPVSSDGARQSAQSSAPAAAEPAAVGAGATRRWNMPSWVILVLGVVVVVLIAAGAYYAFSSRGGSSSLQQGVDAYHTGQREAAVSAFNKAAREDPHNPLPHIYLARMAREVTNYPLAAQELQLALQADPSNALALREMGADLLAQGNFELARRFYVRALQADPTDKTAQGYLGCTLMRLGRVPEATNFLNRAGPGPWTNCTPPATAGQPNGPTNPSAITGQPAPVNPVRRP